MNVLQPWLSEIPMMQQSVLLSAIRGPDGIESYHPVKLLVRWFRRCILISSFDKVVLENPWDDRGGSFTGPSIRPPQKPDWEDEMNDVLRCDYFSNIDRIPYHFHTHLIDASQVLGYKHPNERIRNWWNGAYLYFCKKLHMSPESLESMDQRLSDSKEKWKDLS